MIKYVKTKKQVSNKSPLFKKNWARVKDTKIFIWWCFLTNIELKPFPMCFLCLN